jgi:hypothetical protein
VNRTGLLLLRVLINAEPHNIAKNILCIRFENRQGCASIPITGLMMTDRQATRPRVHKSASHVICPFDHASLGSYLPLSWSECQRWRLFARINWLEGLLDVDKLQQVARIEKCKGHDPICCGRAT